MVAPYKEAWGDEPTGHMLWTSGGPMHLEVLTFASFTQMKSLYKSKWPNQVLCRDTSEGVNNCPSLLGTLKGSSYLTEMSEADRIEFRALLQMADCGVEGGQRVVALHSWSATAFCTRRRERWAEGASDPFGYPRKKRRRRSWNKWSKF